MTQSRRRFLTISAAAAFLPQAAVAAPLARWKGFALGAGASITLAGTNPIDARPVFAAIEAELERLERIFSLYRGDSAISRLNANGRLAAPPPEMLEILAMCETLHRASAGAFDPTIQPLWLALAQGRDPASVRPSVGWDKVHFDTQSVALSHPDMALTLNGIAQGYVTDRIARRLADAGFADILVDIGEIAARGRNPDGDAWQAGVADLHGDIVHRVTLRDRALATSAPMGTRLSADQGHILSPSGGRPVHDLVSVSAPLAVVADGLSTALCLLPAQDAHRAVAAFSGAAIEVLGVRAAP